MGSDNTVIDPSGDLLLISPSPTEPFAPWDRLEAQPPPPPEPQEFRARVSSAVLRLASPVFQIELDPAGPWKQLDIEYDGLRHKRISGFNPQALEHVLNVLHFRNSSVPKAVPVEDLAKMAVVVDYFDCRAAFSFAAESWFKVCDGLPEKQFSRTLVLWLFASSVFDSQPIFEMTAKMAIEHGTGPFRTLDLPFAESVVKLLDELRQTRIELLLTALSAYETQLLQGTGCYPECDAWCLGTLLRCMRGADLHPKPAEPFVGISVAGIYSMVGQFQHKVSSGSFLDHAHRPSHFSAKRRPCDQHKRVDQLFAIISKPYGLDLKKLAV